MTQGLQGRLVTQTGLMLLNRSIKLAYSDFPYRFSYLIPVNTTQMNDAPQSEKEQKEAELSLFPTFCPTDNRLRMYGTGYIIDKDGKGEDNKGTVKKEFLTATVKALEAFGIENPAKKCRTIRLHTYLYGTL